MKKRLIFALLLTSALLVLCACSGQPAPVEDADETKTIQLGTSAFSMDIPAHFVEGEITREDRAENQIAYFHSDETPMDFDIYQFPKADCPDALADFVTQEAERYNTSEVVTDAEINGIAVGYYRSVQNFHGKAYRVIAYAFEDGAEYVEVAFWLDGDDAEADADAIINTLSK